jgi:menaquinone-dependent protoporphyrinogen IX oxidase
MKAIVIYYSRKGSNKFLAEKIAGHLSADIEAIRTRLDVFLLFLLNIHAGNKPLKHNLEDYQKVIVCSPIWMGRIIPPLRSFLQKYGTKIQALYFVTCCGSSDEMKDQKFGHGLVFNEIKAIMKNRLAGCRAFPIVLVLPEPLKKDGKAIMNTRLTDGNFNGSIKERFDQFVHSIHSEC